MKKPDTLDIIWSRLMRGGRTSKMSREKTPANKRAEERYRKHVAMWDDVPSADVATRQRERQSARLRQRQTMTIAKREAMSRSIPGGSAAIRTPADVERLLG